VSMRALITVITIATFIEMSVFEQGNFTAYKQRHDCIHHIVGLLVVTVLVTLNVIYAKSSVHHVSVELAVPH
jgi:hypothetical protein